MAKRRQGIREGNEGVFQALNYVVFTILALLCIYPFYYIVICTISENRLVDAGQVVFLPRNITFENYRNILELPNLGSASLVSVLRTVLGTSLSLLATTYMAYFFTKENMWKRKIWYRYCIATMYFSAGMIPGYMNIRMLGLLNTFAVYIIPGLISVYNMVLIKTYIESIPLSMEESAQIDGAGPVRRLISVVMPLCTPILATIALFSAVGHWNSFMDTLLYITDKRLYTLQYILQMFYKEADMLAEQIASGILSPDTVAQAITPTGIRLTITVVISLPILCVYPFVQRFFVKGIMIGAVKG